MRCESVGKQQKSEHEIRRFSPEEQNLNTETRETGDVMTKLAEIKKLILYHISHTSLDFYGLSLQMKYGDEVQLLGQIGILIE